MQTNYATPARGKGKHEEEAAVHDGSSYASIKLVPFGQLEAAFARYESTHDLSKLIGGSAGKLLDDTQSDGVIDSLRLSRALYDCGIVSLHPKTYTGEVMTDREGRGYIASVTSWKEQLSRLLGAPHHIRLPHDLVGVHGILLFCGTPHGDRLTLSGRLDPSVSFDDARDGVYAFALR